MDSRDSSHAGIDLDVICISDLVAKNDGVAEAPGESIPSDPEDYRVFVNGIIKKMQGRQAFLTFSRQVGSVNQILNMDYSSAKDIARVILKDFGLTTQVLKLVNSSVYRQFSTKGISTISEAMIILGADEIRQLAAGLKIFELMNSAATSRLLKDKIFKSLHRSAVARQIQREMGGDATDAFPISAMLYELGEYLVALLDPDTYIRIDIFMEENGLSKQKASKSILGLTYSELGQMVALKLNLPKKVVHAMRPVTQGTDPNQPIAPQDKARYLCGFIHELCDIPLPADNTGALGAAAQLADKYRGVFDIGAGQALEMTRAAMDRVIRHAEILGIDPEQINAPGPDPCGIKNRDELDIGINRVEDALTNGLSIHKIFTRLIDTMDKSFYFKQIVICIRKKETNTMEPRFIRGEERIEESSNVLGFRIEPESGIFYNAVSQKSDMIIKDIKKEAYKQQIPSRYIEKTARPFHVKGFGIFPIFVDGKILSMIYVDWDENGQPPDQDTLSYIQEFRNRMIRAFTLHSEAKTRDQKR